MTIYDFRSLSPHDFERLSTDLLQAELGKTLESFTTGPDSGIDSRLLYGRTAVIIQCKHFANSSFSTLLANIRNREQRRVASLPAETRYILTTSIGLTPKNKSQLFELLRGRCKSPADIYGKDDLNNLLVKHPTIEERHYKLWLTSTMTLKRIMHAGIVTDTISHIDDVRRRLSRYVPNASLERAKKILDQHHFCIVSGIPGVGKTTLAEVLVAHLVDKDGFTPFRVNSRLEEIRPIKDRSRKQVFYFDDFLGRTDLIHLERNEDRHLVELMFEVSCNDRWRLILTTREYILRAAAEKYEAIHQLPDDLARCIVDVADYTRRVRAQILYNHIYFSDIPKSHKLAILEPPKRPPALERGHFSYRDVIDHRNYLPRLIEFMTGPVYYSHRDVQGYVSDFSANLHDPSRIWEHAFRQVSDASQRLVLILATLPRRVHEEDARQCFLQFSRYRQKEYGSATGADDWDNALRELDGSFVASSRARENIALQFHNPSVEDFIKGHLRRSRSDAPDLLASVLFFDQYVRLWMTCRTHFASDDSTFFDSVRSSVPAQRVRVVSATTGSIVRMPIEGQVSFLIALAGYTGRDVSEAATGAVASMANLWQRGESSNRDVLRLLLYWRRKVGDVPTELLIAARDLLLDVDDDDIEGFEIGARFIEKFADSSSEEACAHLADKFNGILWDFEYVESVDELLEITEILELVEKVLGADVQHVMDSVNERIVKLEEDAEEVGNSNGPTEWESDDYLMNQEKGIDKMFEGLRHLLASS